jgi:signal transduction histidine kinase
LRQGKISNIQDCASKSREIQRNCGDLARVGEPFYTTKPTGQGMGLGVFPARAVAERLGGGLVLHSVAGQGTVATFSLPLGPASSVSG